MQRRTIIAALFMIACGLLLAVRCGNPPVEDTTLRVMTYNLHHCEGEDGVYDVSRIAQFMRELEADIVLCQEVDRGYSERSKMENQPELLAEMLGFHSFYGPNIGETYGNLILSRFPIDSAENVVLPNPEDIEPRGVIVSTITVGEHTFSVLDTHLSAFSETNRDVQVQFLRELVRKLEHPVIFGADFNSRPTGQLKPLLDYGVVMSSRILTTRGEGIDDILVSSGLSTGITAGEVVENIFSDHPAFWIELNLEAIEQ